MSKNSITLSKKHGTNPSILHCIACGKEYGLALLGKLKKDAEAPKDTYHGLCNDCQNVVDQGGLLIIEAKDGETGDNPYRTGRMVGISKDCRERMFKNTESPICYMEQTLFTQMFGETLNTSNNEEVKQNKNENNNQ